MNKNVRQLILSRDNHTCQLCNKTDKSLDVHHKFPVRFGGDDSHDNLIALCEQCHSTADQWQIEAIPNMRNKDLIIESIEGIIKKYSNGAHIVLPKSWIGREVIVRVKNNDDDEDDN